jgi:EmrB/QacA subfamily drug resistance transporter
MRLKIENDMGQNIIHSSRPPLAGEGRVGASRAGDSRWLALIILCAGFLMIVLDQTIVNVALPSIKNDLGFSQAGLAWVVNAYLIAFGGFLLLAGRLGDLLGRKRIFLVGLAMFTTASLLCGLSISQPMLVAARFLQGIGGAVSTAVILGMVITMFQEPAERARAIGVFSFVASAGASIGLLAGGLITQAVSWHWIFFVNLPIGIVIAILASRLLESDRGIGLRSGADALGAVLITSGLMLGVYTIVESSTYGLGSARTLGLGAVAIALVVAFIIRQAKVTTPLLPLRLFRPRHFSGANVIQALATPAMFSFFFLGSLYLQRVLHYGPLAMGLAFLPVALGMGLLSIGVTARLIVRFGAYAVVLVGLSTLTVALGLAARGPVVAAYFPDLFIPMALLGIGGGLAFPALFVLAMARTAPSDSGVASGLINTTGQVAGALGLAVLATLSTSRTSELLGHGQALTAALSSGYHLAWAIGAGLALVSLVIAATMLRPERAPEVKVGIEAEEIPA